MLSIDGLHCPPAYSAVLHHLKRRGRIAVQEPHPRIYHENVETVVRQSSCGVRQVTEQTGDLSFEGSSQTVNQRRRVNPVQLRASDPVAAYDVGVERVIDADRFGNGAKIGPCAVEFPGVRGNSGRIVATQHSYAGRTAITEFVRRERVPGEQCVAWR